MSNINELMQWLDKGVSPWHTVKHCADYLAAQGFEALELAQPFNVTRGGRYYIAVGSFLAAVDIGAGDTLHIAAAHTDWPCMRVKPQGEQVSAGCCKLSVEHYGGAILSSWLDRPLGLAGVALVRTDDPMHPARHLVAWNEPVAVIPNVAIHLNRDVNKGTAYKENIDMLPICATVREKWEKDGYLVRQLAKRLDVAAEDILSFELCAYCAQKAALVGFEGDMLSSPRLDNITSVHAVIRALVDSRAKGINIAVLYDNEEIGSNTRRGADSATLSVILEKLALSLGLDRGALLDAALGGMLLSCDVAHAMHPNHPELADSACAPMLGRGVALKRSPRYSSDAETCAIITALCQSHDIPMQLYMNRADMAGGSTVGSMASALLSMPAADIGVPILAMHSACELMGAADQDAIVKLCTAFYSA